MKNFTGIASTVGKKLNPNQRVFNFIRFLFNVRKPIKSEKSGSSELPTGSTKNLNMKTITNIASTIGKKLNPNQRVFNFIFNVRKSSKSEKPAS